MAPTPTPQGLYDPANEHDACGVAFVVDMKGRRTHDLVEKGITALVHLEHRGASGAEVNTGDGAGILIQVPDTFFRAVVDFDLPPAGAYATGIAFLPADAAGADAAVESIDKIVASEDLAVLGWREVPTDARDLGTGAAGAMPTFRQVFIGGKDHEISDLELERRVYVARKRVEHEVGTEGDRVYFPSLSCRTFIYKGMLTTPQLRDFYQDLQDPRMESAIALV